MSVKSLQGRRTEYAKQRFSSIMTVNDMHPCRSGGLIIYLVKNGT